MVVSKLLIEIAPNQVVQPSICTLPCGFGRQHARRNAACAQIRTQSTGAFPGGKILHNRIKPNIFFKMPPLFVRLIFAAALCGNHILLPVPRWKRRHFNRGRLKNFSVSASPILPAEPLPKQSQPRFFIMREVGVRRAVAAHDVCLGEYSTIVNALERNALFIQNPPNAVILPDFRRRIGFVCNYGLNIQPRRQSRQFFHTVHRIQSHAARRQRAMQSRRRLIMKPILTRIGDFRRPLRHPHACHRQSPLHGGGQRGVVAYAQVAAEPDQCMCLHGDVV